MSNNIVEIHHAHSLTVEQAKQKADNFAKSLNKGALGFEYKWNGDVAEVKAVSGIAKGTTGTISLTEKEVVVKVELPLMLAAFKSMVEKSIREKLNELV